jgi:hypothetical protein
MRSGSPTIRTSRRRHRPRPEHTRDHSHDREYVRRGERTSFQTLWGDHIAFVADARALAGKGKAARDAAGPAYRFQLRVRHFLSTSRVGVLEREALVDAFVMHEEVPLKQIRHTPLRTTPRHTRCSSDAYKHMFALVDQAATAIGKTVAVGSPKGGAETGVGATRPPRDGDAQAPHR